MVVVPRRMRVTVRELFLAGLPGSLDLHVEVQVFPGQGVITIEHDGADLDLEDGHRHGLSRRSLHR